MSIFVATFKKIINPNYKNNFFPKLVRVPCESSPSSLLSAKLTYARLAAAAAPPRYIALRLLLLLSLSLSLSRSLSRALVESIVCVGPGRATSLSLSS